MFYVRCIEDSSVATVRYLVAVNPSVIVGGVLIWERFGDDCTWYIAPGDRSTFFAVPTPNGAFRTALVAHRSGTV